MADTASLLPQLRPVPESEKDNEAVHYPVLVPNMRGLENLFKLEEENRNVGKGRLTDEIAVFVSASDVSRAQLCATTPGHRELTSRLSPRPTTVPQSRRSWQVCRQSSRRRYRRATVSGDTCRLS